MSGQSIDQFVGGKFAWFTGVVEDTSDPLQMGRVRVRCFGYHTEDKVQIPTESLPWALVMTPITSASMSGIGTSG
jgi:Gp5 N-terminal OB domain